MAVSIADALGTAWTLRGLYPDPEKQEAFQRACDALAAFEVPTRLEVSTEGFEVEGEPIALKRDGSLRLARQCYLHNIEVVRVEAGAAGSDVIKFLSLLNSDVEQVRGSGGMEAALRRSGVSSFSVVQRVLLTEEGAVEEAVDRAARVEAVLKHKDDPEGLALEIIDLAGGDALVVGRIFHERYATSLAEVTEEDVNGREDLVRTFVEAFFFLPDTSQVTTFSAFLAALDDDGRMFLDQFAGHELVKMAPLLDTSGFSLLLEYARVGTDQADRRPEELMALLDEPDAVDFARRVVAAAVSDRLEGATGEATSSPAFDALAAQIPDSRRFFYHALETFRGLLHVEIREDRFRRLLRIWSGKIRAGLRLGEIRRSELWLRAVTDHPTYGPEFADAVRSALEQLASADLVSEVVGYAQRSRDPEGAVRFLAHLGPSAVGQVVALLADEEEAATRRALVDILAVMARRDASQIVAHMNDERWYVVRNLVTVLGKVGSPEALQSVRQAVSHADHRVRLVALRALAAGDRQGSVSSFRTALRDSNPSVRKTAVGLLSSGDVPGGEAVLLEALGIVTDSADRARIIRALGDSGGEAAVAELTRLAKKRWVFTSSAREVREAARVALRSME